LLLDWNNETGFSTDGHPASAAGLKQGHARRNRLQACFIPQSFAEEGHVEEPTNRNEHAYSDFFWPSHLLGAASLWVFVACLM